MVKQINNKLKLKSICGKKFSECNENENFTNIEIDDEDFVIHVKTSIDNVIKHDININFDLLLTKDGPKWILSCCGKDIDHYDISEIRKVVANDEDYLEFIDFIEKYWKNIEIGNY